jgi:hypothetical protein
MNAPMIRKSIWAVLAGFLLLMALSISADFLLWALFPETFGHSGANLTWLASMVTILYGAASCVAGGYLTARLSGSRPVMHAAVLGGVMLLCGLVGLVGSRAPVWFNLGFLAMILPSVWAGALVRTRRAKT